MVERRSLADSASSPVDDELRDISDTSFSSDRMPPFRPPMPPPLPPPSFFGYRPSPGFIPPFYSRRLPPDRLHSPPDFDPYRDDPYMRDSLRPRDGSPPGRRQPMLSDRHRSAPIYDDYDGRSPPPRGNSPPYYDRRGGRRSPLIYESRHCEERYERRSPHSRESSPQPRDRYSRQDRSRTSDEEISVMPSNMSRVRSHPPSREDMYHQSHSSHYTSHRPPDPRPPAVRSPPADAEDYPTY